MLHLKAHRWLDDQELLTFSLCGATASRRVGLTAFPKKVQCAECLVSFDTLQTLELASLTSHPFAKNGRLAVIVSADAFPFALETRESSQAMKVLAILQQADAVPEAVAALLDRRPRRPRRR